VNDQASTLRVLRGGSIAAAMPRPQRRSLAVTGGKGGVGKSSLALNLALARVERGSRTLMVDADLGMADLNLLVGVAPSHSMLDALGGMPIDQVLVAAHGLHLLPALNGSSLLATLGPTGQQRLLELIDGIAANFDTIVIDVAAGLGLTQAVFASATTTTLVVANPEPLSMADAYASLKVLATEHGVRRAYLLPNRVTSRAQGDELVARLSGLVGRFLDLELIALPPIPADPMFQEAAQFGVPLLVHAPQSVAARALRLVDRVLDSHAAPASVDAAPTWWRAAAGDRR